GLVLYSTGEVILRGVTGQVKHGRLTAIMGQSGCGKSTFLTTLAGRAFYGKTLGKVFVNGVESNLRNLNSKMGFVPQDDIMLRDLTVEETLLFSARTRLSGIKSMKEIYSIVDNAIHLLR